MSEDNQELTPIRILINAPHYQLSAKLAEQDRILAIAAFDNLSEEARNKLELNANGDAFTHRSYFLALMYDVVNKPTNTTTDNELIQENADLKEKMQKALEEIQELSNKLKESATKEPDPNIYELKKDSKVLQEFFVSLDQRTEKKLSSTAEGFIFQLFKFTAITLGNKACEKNGIQFTPDLYEK